MAQKPLSHYSHTAFLNKIKCVVSTHGDNPPDQRYQIRLSLQDKDGQPLPMPDEDVQDFRSKLNALMHSKAGHAAPDFLLTRDPINNDVRQLAARGMDLDTLEKMEGALRQASFTVKRWSPGHDFKPYVPSDLTSDEQAQAAAMSRTGAVAPDQLGKAVIMSEPPEAREAGGPRTDAHLPSARKRRAEEIVQDVTMTPPPGAHDRGTDEMLVLNVPIGPTARQLVLNEFRKYVNDEPDVEFRVHREDDPPTLAVALPANAFKVMRLHAGNNREVNAENLAAALGTLGNNGLQWHHGANGDPETKDAMPDAIFASGTPKEVYDALVQLQRLGLRVRDFDWNTAKAYFEGAMRAEQTGMGQMGSERSAPPELRGGNDHGVS